MTIFLDTETTGFSPLRGDRIVEIGIVDANGRTLLETLVNPQRPIPWQARNVHGISDEMVRGMPTIEDVMPQVLAVITNQQVVIYNSSFDTPFFPGMLREAAEVSCAMRRFAQARGCGWTKLGVAASMAGHCWTGEAHRALADALACRSVWNWLDARR